MQINQHFKELKQRLTVIIVTFLVAVIALTASSSYILKRIILYYGVELYNFSPIESVKVQISFGIITALIVTLPIIMYQIYKFVTYDWELKLPIKRIISASYVLALTGFMFGITYMAKIMLNVMHSYTIGDIVWGLENTLKLVFGIGLIMGLCTQLIIIIPILNKIGLINTKKITFKTKYIAFVCILIISALITPPDIITQLMITLPVFVCIETGILMSKIGGKRKWQSEQWKASLSG